MNQDNSSELESSLNETLFKCSDCNLFFKSKKALSVHKTRSSTHQNLKLVCDGCKIRFNSIGRLELHLNVCPNSVEKQQKEKEEKVKANYEEMIKTLQQNLEQTQSCLLRTQNDLEKAQSELSRTQGKLEAYEEIQMSSTKSITNYYIQQTNLINYQSVVERLPMVREADIVGLIKNAPYESFDSSESLGQYLTTNYLNDRLVTTDASRGVVAWKDENRTIIKDKGAVEISKKITKIGSSTKYEIDKKLKAFDEKMDQTNISHLMNINNKKDTYDCITSQNPKFSKELGKTIAKYTPVLATFKELPKVKIETFRCSVKEFLDKFGDPLVQHSCKTFIEHFCDKFNLIKTNNGINSLKDFTRGMNFVKLHEALISKKINFFVLNRHTYFLDDIDNVYTDKNSNFICFLLLSFLKGNIMKNANRNNKASYFKFTNTDIVLLCNKHDFYLFAQEILRDFF